MLKLIAYDTNKLANSSMVKREGNPSTKWPPLILPPLQPLDFSKRPDSPCSTVRPPDRSSCVFREHSPPFNFPPLAVSPINKCVQIVAGLVEVQ